MLTMLALYLLVATSLTSLAQGYDTDRQFAPVDHVVIFGIDGLSASKAINYIQVVFLVQTSSVEHLCNIKA
jgi:hypothetical protein